MSSDRSVRIHLGPEVLKSAQAGKHNFLNRLTNVLVNAGYTPEYRDNSFAERILTGAQPGWSMFEMEPPEGPRSLVFRRAYVAPFWQIDRTDKRWDWDVARAEFDPGQQPMPEARTFANAWRQRLYNKKADASVRGGIIYVPLQARLTERRPFQAASPIEMIEMVLDRFPGRRVIATLHPNLYPDPPELEALAELTARRPALRIERHPSGDLLQRCDFVVTENSAVAFEALFFRKPALLFAGIDFHHPFASVWRDGADKAFVQLAGPPPDFDAYLYWYLQVRSLNAGRETFEDRALARLAELGLDMGQKAGRVA